MLFFSQVREVFAESPFFIPKNSVSIMNGTNEGMPVSLLISLHLSAC